MRKILMMLAAAALALPLSAAQPWTQVKAWNNQQFPKDHHWKDDIVTKDKW